MARRGETPNFLMTPCTPRVHPLTFHFPPFRLLQNLPLPNSEAVCDNMRVAKQRKKEKKHGSQD